MYATANCRTSPGPSSTFSLCETQTSTLACCVSTKAESSPKTYLTNNNCRHRSCSSLFTSNKDLRLKYLFCGLIFDKKSNNSDSIGKLDTSKSGSTSPSRKFGPAQSLYKIPQVNPDAQDSPEEIIEGEDYITKEILRRRSNTLRTAMVEQKHPYL